MRWLIAVFIIGASVAPSVAAGATDPFVWIPPTAVPSPEGMLAEDEYAKRLEAALAGVDLAALAKSDKPVGGMEIIEVVPGSQAEELSVVVGNVITAFDGKPVRFFADFAERRDDDRQQTLEMWAKGAGRRQLRIDKRRIGITLRPRWSPEVGYFREPDRSPKWDRAMVAAGLTYNRDPELAVTALAHAKSAGYSGIYLHPLQACACYQLGRYAEALALGEAGIKRLAADEGAELIYALYASALLGGKWAEARSVLAYCPDLHGEDGFEPYLAEHAERVARKTVSTNPMESFDQGPSFDLMNMVRSFDIAGANTTHMMREIARGNATLDTTLPLDRQMSFMITPPSVKSLDITFGFHLAKVDNNPGFLILGVKASGPDTPANNVSDPNDLKFSTNIDNLGESSVSFAGLTNAVAPAIHGAGDYVLRFAIKDGLIASVINGQQHCFAPILRGDEPLSVYLVVHGMQINLRVIKIVTHDAQPPPGWKPTAQKPDAPKPPAAAAKPDDKGKKADDF